MPFGMELRPLEAPLPAPRRRWSAGAIQARIACALPFPQVAPIGPKTMKTAMTANAKKSMKKPAAAKAKKAMKKPAAAATPQAMKKAMRAKATKKEL